MALDELYAICIVLLVWLIIELMFTIVPLVLIKKGNAACIVDACNMQLHSASCPMNCLLLQKHHATALITLGCDNTNCATMQLMHAGRVTFLSMSIAALPWQQTLDAKQAALRSCMQHVACV